MEVEGKLSRRDLLIRGSEAALGLTLFGLAACEKSNKPSLSKAAKLAEGFGIERQEIFKIGSLEFNIYSENLGELTPEVIRQGLWDVVDSSRELSSEQPTQWTKPYEQAIGRSPRYFEGETNKSVKVHIVIPPDGYYCSQRSGEHFVHIPDTKDSTIKSRCYNTSNKTTYFDKSGFPSETVITPGSVQTSDEVVLPEGFRPTSRGMVEIQLDHEFGHFLIDLGGGPQDNGKPEAERLEEEVVEAIEARCVQKIAARQ